MVHGADLSTFQRHVDYVALGKAVGFGYVKATDAKLVNGAWALFEDDMHQTHALGVRAQLRPTGDYAFGHPSMDVGAHADHFVAHAWFDQLRPVLDQESLAGGHIPANAGAWVKSWLDRVRANTGTAPLIYSGAYYASEIVRQCPALAVEDWWIAAYPGLVAAPETMPTVRGIDPMHVLAWQWTGSGTLPGIAGHADRDVAPRLEPLYI